MSVRRLTTALAATLTTAVAGIALAATASAAPVNPTQLDTPFHVNNETGYTLQRTSWSTDNHDVATTLRPHTDGFLTDDVFLLGHNNSQNGTYKVVGTPYTVDVYTNPAYGLTYPAGSRCGVKENGHWVNPPDFTCVGDGTTITLGTPVTWTISPADNAVSDFTLATGTNLTSLRDQGGLGGWNDGGTTISGPMTLTTVAGVDPQFTVYSPYQLMSDSVTIDGTNVTDTTGWLQVDSADRTISVDCAFTRSVN